MSDFKAAKEHLNFLQGGKVSGNFKLKPMLVNHSETSRAMRGSSKDNLYVI
jgi:hypothetical protein